MKWKKRTLDEIAEMICGNIENNASGEPKHPPYFKYLSSMYITRFFRDADTDHKHDGTSRAVWVSNTLEKIMAEPQSDSLSPPDSFCRIIARLMDLEDANTQHDPDRSIALAKLNASLRREGFEAFYADDQKCYLRHVSSGMIATAAVNPHRPFLRDELERREHLAAYLDIASEDQLIEEVLLPMFRQLNFHRVTVAGHKDKALEYGKDLWMRFTLPTRHNLYFGLQAKRDKLDAAGANKSGTANVAEILNQVNMMLGHEIFDPETNRRVLVDHAFIVAGGQITKAARNWLGEHLDRTKRSQIIFMDRDDILNLFIVTSIPLPAAAKPSSPIDDEMPF